MRPRSRVHHEFGRPLRRATNAALSSCGKLSTISNHGDLNSTKMWRSGRSCGSSSRAPAGTSNHGVSGFGFGTGEPQRVQKYVRYPGATSRTGASYARINSQPEVRRKSSRRTPTVEVNAEPPAFLHLVQCHSSNGPTARVISNFTPPQRQLPRIIPGSPARSGWLEGAV